MRFAEAQLLWLLLALPLLALVAWWGLLRRERTLARFAGGRDWLGRFNDEVSMNRRAVKLLLVGGALGCLILAAARPQWGTQFEEVTRSGADIVLVVDTSLSMAAQDVAPDRLALARHGIDTLLERLTGDRVALVTFAGRATLACPLTLDHAAVRLFLDATDTESVPVPGTALAEALGAALRAFGQQEAVGAPRTRAIVLWSDGEDHEGGVDEALPALEAARVAVYAVGVGTARGAPIPVGNADGASTGYKTDREGKVVTTRLDETVLERLALETGGQYHRATAAQDELDTVARALEELDQQEFGATLRARYRERFQWPLAAALLALLGESLLGDRRRPRRANGGSPAEARR